MGGEVSFEEARGAFVNLVIALICGFLIISCAGDGGGSTSTNTNSNNDNHYLSDNHVASDNQLNIGGTIYNAPVTIVGAQTTNASIVGNNDTMMTGDGVKLCKGDNGTFTSSNCAVQP